jgi:hypothetical protein
MNTLDQYDKIITLGDGGKCASRIIKFYEGDGWTVFIEENDIVTEYKRFYFKFTARRWADRRLKELTNAH